MLISIQDILTPDTEFKNLCIVHSPTNALFIIFIKSFKFTLKYTIISLLHVSVLKLLMPNDDYSCRTAPLTSKRHILYIYSTHIGTEYFKHGKNSPFFPLHNAVCFIILTYLVPGLFTFYIQGVLKLKK